jgi:predicted nucleic acid-binding protein
MAANSVFLDTNGWFALLNERDDLHFEAQSIWRGMVQAFRPVTLTDWIVAETGNGLARTAARTRFATSWERVLRSPRVRVIFVDSILMQRALALYAERADKAWGLVDCASFVVMADQGITDAFTTDRHFEQAGFRCLLPAAES